MKNIDIWPSYRPKLPSKYQLFLIWAYVFWLAIFWPIGREIFMGIQKTIIYRFVMRNHDLNAFLKKNGGKMGVAATLASKGLGSQDPTKKLAYRVKLLENRHLTKFRAWPLLNITKQTNLFQWLESYRYFSCVARAKSNYFRVLGWKTFVTRRPVVKYSVIKWWRIALPTVI